ncbi:MAG: hypothetical protein WCJ66_13650 [Verrucomicrobiota bacterium]
MKSTMQLDSGNCRPRTAADFGFVHKRLGQYSMGKIATNPSPDILSQLSERAVAALTLWRGCPRIAKNLNELQQRCAFDLFHSENTRGKSRENLGSGRRNHFCVRYYILIFENLTHYKSTS